MQEKASSSVLISQFLKLKLGDFWIPVGNSYKVGPKHPIEGNVLLGRASLICGNPETIAQQLC